VAGGRLDLAAGDQALEGGGGLREGAHGLREAHERGAQAHALVVDDVDEAEGGELAQGRGDLPPHDLGGDALVTLIVERTHTCYKGARGTRYDWGYGCGTCPACELRAKGYWEWRERVG
jgi:7-cyano-7-deazaguanine synthase in queuosine biosynthesis